MNCLYVCSLSSPTSSAFHLKLTPMTLNPPLQGHSLLSKAKDRQDACSTRFLLLTSILLYMCAHFYHYKKILPKNNGKVKTIQNYQLSIQN